MLQAAVHGSDLSMLPAANAGAGIRHCKDGGVSGRVDHYV